MPQISIAPICAKLGTDPTVAAHTVPAGEEHSLSIRVTNITAAAANVSLWLVPTGQARGDQHTRLRDFALSAKESKDVEVALPVPPGAKLHLAASAVDTIVASICGTRIVL